jgi:hypothetical protein
VLRPPSGHEGSQRRTSARGPCPAPSLKTLSPLSPSYDYEAKGGRATTSSTAEQESSQANPLVSARGEAGQDSSAQQQSSRAHPLATARGEATQDLSARDVSKRLLPQGSKRKLSSCTLIQIPPLSRHTKARANAIVGITGNIEPCVEPSDESAPEREAREAPASAHLSVKRQREPSDAHDSAPEGVQRVKELSDTGEEAQRPPKRQSEEKGPNSRGGPCTFSAAFHERSVLQWKERHSQLASIKPTIETLVAGMDPSDEGDTARRMLMRLMKQAEEFPNRTPSPTR